MQGKPINCLGEGVQFRVDEKGPTSNTALLSAEEIMG